MATIAAPSLPSAEQRERAFFLAMAVALAVTVVFAFGYWHHLGRSTFHSPWFTHLHALSFIAWMGIYLTQNALVFLGDTRRHRALGKVGAGWAVWLMVIGLIQVPVSLSLNRQAPIFTPPFFLAIDWGTIVIFAVLTGAALARVRRTDWHRRLMLCATIALIAPAWGRLLALFDAEGAWTNAAALIVYVLVAMIADIAIRKRIHPAYYWGLAALVAWPVAVELLIRVPPFVALAERIHG